MIYNKYINLIYKIFGNSIDYGNKNQLINANEMYDEIFNKPDLVISIETRWKLNSCLTIKLSKCLF